jgi:hypothetical protein
VDDAARRVGAAATFHPELAQPQVDGDLHGVVGVLRRELALALGAAEEPARVRHELRVGEALACRERAQKTLREIENLLRLGYFLGGSFTRTSFASGGRFDSDPWRGFAAARALSGGFTFALAGAELGVGFFEG